MELIRQADGSLKCSECSTLLRSGQPHTALEPTPHQSLEALVVYETLEEMDSKDGSHGWFE